MLKKIFERDINTLEHLLHGDESPELLPEDSNVLTSDYANYIITANSEVTVKYYEH